MLGKSVPETSARRPEPDDQGEDGISRRNALISIGKYAAYVTPAMTVLIRGDTGLAGHSCGSPNNNNPPHSCTP